MTTWVALLRGVNVGGVKLAMSDLRAAIEAAGGTEVETYIQSGNAVFGHAGRSEAEVKAAVEAEIGAVTGRRVPTMLRRGTQMAAVVDANPYEPELPTHLHVTFFDEELPTDAFSAIDLEAFAPETFTVHGREVYLHLPNGMGRSKLAVELTRRAASAPTGTARNWNTVRKLAELSRR